MRNYQELYAYQNEPSIEFTEAHFIINQNEIEKDENKT